MLIVNFVLWKVNGYILFFVNTNCFNFKKKNFYIKDMVLAMLKQFKEQGYSCGALAEGFNCKNLYLILPKLVSQLK